MNRQNLEIKCQRHFHTYCICCFQRIHQHTKDINVPEEQEIFTMSWRQLRWACYAMVGVLQWGIWSTHKTWKCDKAKNMKCENYMLVQFKKLNNMKNVCASSEHFRSSAHIRFIVMTLRLRRWSAPGSNILRSSGISHVWNICWRCPKTWIPLVGMRCYILTTNKICILFKSLFTAGVSIISEQPSYFRPQDFTLENSISYVVFCWFFATTTHQRVIFELAQAKRGLTAFLT